MAPYSARGNTDGAVIVHHHNISSFIFPIAMTKLVSLQSLIVNLYRGAAENIIAVTLIAVFAFTRVR